MVEKSEKQLPGWSLEELVERANARIGAVASQTEDKRQASSMTARNLRRLVAEGAIDPPERFGREARYAEAHLEQLVAARQLMSKGMSASTIQKLRQSATEEAQGSDPAPSSALYASASSAGLSSGSNAISGAAGSPAYLSQSFSASLAQPTLTGSSFSGALPEAPSTQGALDFLNALPSASRSASISGSVSAQGAASIQSSGPLLHASPTVMPDKEAGQSLSSSIYALTAAAVAGSNRSRSKAYFAPPPAHGPKAEAEELFAFTPTPQELGEQGVQDQGTHARPAMAPRIAMTKIEAEAGDGVSVSVLSRPGMAAIDAPMRERLLQAFEQAWERARAIGELGAARPPERPD